MKRKNMGLKKKLVLSKETIANLTPAQQAKVAGGYHAATAAITCLPESANYSDCNCGGKASNAPNNCNQIPTAGCQGGYPVYSAYCLGPTANGDCQSN